MCCHQGCFLLDYLDYVVFCQAKNDIPPSGDCFFISNGAPWLLLLADGLGSGEKARLAADTAVSLAEEFCMKYQDHNRSLLLPNLITRCHQNLKNTRGAAVAGVLLDSENKRLHFCGVGNIRFTIAGRVIKSLFSQPGIVGVQTLPRVTVKTMSTEGYHTGFLFTDGISLDSVLTIARNPYLSLNKLAEEVILLNNNVRDDKTVIVFSIPE